MKPRIKTREDYKDALIERAEINNKKINSKLTCSDLMRLGVLNNDIAEYEERQNQMPDLSFITEPKGDLFSMTWTNDEAFNSEKEVEVFYACVENIPKIIKFLQRAAETDPEALELLQTIAKPLK